MEKKIWHGFAYSPYLFSWVAWVKTQWLNVVLEDLMTSLCMLEGRITDNKQALSKNERKKYCIVFDVME